MYNVFYMYFLLCIEYMYDIFYIYFLLSIKYNGKFIGRLLKKKFASFFSSYVVSELARFARGRIEDSSLTGSRSTAFQNCLPHCFSA